MRSTRHGSSASGVPALLAIVALAAKLALLGALWPALGEAAETTRSNKMRGVSWVAGPEIEGADLDAVGCK